MTPGQQGAADRVYDAVDALNAAMKEAGLVGMEVNLTQERGRLVAVCMVPVRRRGSDEPDARQQRLELARSLVNRLGRESIPAIAGYCGVTMFQVGEWYKGSQVPSEDAYQKLEELEASLPPMDP